MTIEKIKLDKNTEFHKGLKKFAEGLYIFGQEISKALIPMVEALQNILNRIDHERLIEFFENIQKINKYEPYLNEVIEDLKCNKNLSHVSDSISLACFYQLIYENETNPYDLDLFDVVRTKYFNDMFFSLFDSLELGENFKLRKNIIKEAFKLYELEFYAGCLALLYGQLEGILTDYLIQRNLLIKNGNFYNYLGNEFDYNYKNGNKKTIKSSSKITSIDNKVIIAANFNKPESCLSQ